MDRLTGGALAAVLLSLTLGACGGSGSEAPAAPAGGGGQPAAVQGVSTPSSVSVVTAKNAQ
jgi:hypothetical protein